MRAKYPGRCVRCNIDFPIDTEITWKRGVGAAHATEEQCRAAIVSRAVVKETPPKVDLKPIVEFLYAARDRGLKRPKLRVLSLDEKTELAISITRGGAAPGSLAVTEGGRFIGCVRPNGTATGELAKNADYREHLLTVAHDPIRAAKEYAALKCACSFCGQQLTDAGSVEVGYGPICAKHWGLPHRPKGTPNLAPVPKDEDVRKAFQEAAQAAVEQAKREPYEGTVPSRSRFHPGYWTGD